MLRAMTTAASGMHAQQTRIDAIANNIANVNTAGFKASSAQFQDLLYERVAQGAADANPIEVGHGVRIAATSRNLDVGAPEATNDPLDVMIEGDGFLQVEQPNGDIAYTRDGNFQLDRDGNVVTADGNYLFPRLTVPQDATQISIGPTGDVSVVLPGNDGEATQIGQLQIARFTNPEGLRSAGSNQYQRTEASGDAVVGNPGDDSLGVIRQGALERSNVEVVKELVGMIAAQRAYELNSRSIQTADDMLQTVNNIRR